MLQEDMTTGIKLVLSFHSPGTESETKAFMAVCIETAKRYNLDDYRTPVFIFERLCSIIYPVSGFYSVPAIAQVCGSIPLPLIPCVLFPRLLLKTHWRGTRGGTLDLL